jgi:N6-L-threonylcarbamoyladenine synthase
MMPGPVLGIETSCDETAAAVLDAEGRVLAEAVLSQMADHAAFGGVVPEIAARAHLAHLPAMVASVMRQAGLGFTDLGGVAATSGPGLIGGLIVGSGFARGVAIAQRLPFVAVNHLEAHALTPRLPGLAPGGAPFPYLLLLVSGGHCQCVAVEALGRYRRLGGTVDDAAGEAFDKVGKLLGLPWPGGPAVERLARQGDPSVHPLPRPMLGRPGCDFSFSGLKTAVAQLVDRFPAGPLPAHIAADIAAGFQAAVAEVLADRAANALGMMPTARLLVVAGGVAANAAVRHAIEAVAEANEVTLVAPPPKLCTDNAVMVAWAGIERLRAGLASPLDTAPRPRWPLDELAT